MVDDALEKDHPNRESEDTPYVSRCDLYQVSSIDRPGETGSAIEADVMETHECRRRPAVRC